MELKTRSLTAARAFYVDQLGLRVVQEASAIKLLALTAGGLRLSIFETDAAIADHAAHVIYRTDDLEKMRAELSARGVTFEGEVREAPGFMRYLVTRDPDGRPVEIAQYLREPLTPWP